ncbi:MAG TPA: metalloregulator ArsR/SmtB family transcription factor [Burkholderiales bacterium]|jgi:DNA-binding transcriptional ArsR family regulator|nr:metalloregulator ArsR/SmtB family transcription factor [Burkholderiales bacterium]
MVNFETPTAAGLSGPALDAVFAALADGTRRAVLQSLDAGPRSVTELAAPHGMSLPGFMKHLRVLEDAGLIAREKSGRVVSCTLSPAPMRDAAAWLAHYEKFWNERLDALARYLYHDKEINACPPPPKSARRSTSPAPSPRPRKGSGGRGPKPKR